MSSASIPPPRTKAPGEPRSPGSARHTLFLPVFIFFIGAGSLAYYQVLALGDQLETLTQTGDRMDARVKRADYEKVKFFKIAHDILALASKDPNADLIATQYKLRKLAEAKPELMNANAPNEFDLTNFNSPVSSSATNSTNAAPPATNAAPNPSPATSH